MTAIAAPPSTARPDLPVHLSRFVGRDRELDEVARLLGSERLVTLTGPGGSGKTRLAVEASARAAAGFERVVWVDLAPLTDPALLTAHVAATLGAPERAGVPNEETILELLCGARSLVVLDNCEHLVDACAALVDTLLRGCRVMTVLATSREALGVASETAWLVPPLAGEEAVQLFVDRARAAVPGFDPVGCDEHAIHEICRRLDGIPLAIELAAARARVLTPSQIAERLDDAFRLLAGGSRTALPRHRTLRATMDWSHALLAPRDQVLLRRLAVFHGSFGLDTAEALCAGAPLDTDDILDGIAALVDRSLIVMEPGDGEARYHLLETVRQYAFERLVAAGEEDERQRRHAEHFLRIVEESAPFLVGGATRPGLVAQLRREYDNIRAATRWSLADPARAGTALRFGGALFWFWYALGSFRDMREFLDRALALPAPGDSLPRAHALVSSGLTALAQGDYARSIAHLREAIPVLRAHGEVATLGAATAKLGAARFLAGEGEAAIATLDEAIRMTEDCPEGDMSAIFARFWRGWAGYGLGDLELPRRLLGRNLEVARAHGLETTLAHSLAVLARVEFAAGDLPRACEYVLESLEREAAIGDGWGIALALDVVAMAAAARGRHEDAVRLVAGTEALRERLAMALPGIAPLERERFLAELRATVGAEYEALHAAGRAVSTERLLQLGFAEAQRHTVEQRAPRPSAPRAAGPAPDGRPRLRVRALGALQVSVGDRLIEPSAWGSARPRELLVYLLLHPEGRTKEQVGLAFWPEASAAQLRNSFHVTLHRLRKALAGSDWVTLDGERYRVDPALVAEFDVAAFARDLPPARRALLRRAEGAEAALERVLEGFRGDLLDGEPAGDWHLEFRARLQRLFIEALMDLAAAHAREERHAKALEAYRRVLARDALHEEAVRGAMRTHAAAGERAAALRTYQQYADRLRAELEVEPDRETTQLLTRIQAGGAA